MPVWQQAIMQFDEDRAYGELLASDWGIVCTVWWDGPDDVPVPVRAAASARVAALPQVERGRFDAALLSLGMTEAP